ncbi:Yip1 family protein [Flavobacterium sp.]|uniref:Yip1 family protein n=1 Tax=Flavobacterium sp. TaxID=239 RepID=UPI0026301C58|nr:Yip1 family protein [Flavobacterium sp.]
MVENFKDLEDKLNTNYISEENIFTKIWTSPREVFKFINTYKYNKYVTVLLILAGISRTFDRASMKNMGDYFSIWGIIAFSILIGVIFGWITYYLYSALISWTGKWINGKGNTDSILRVLSYALIPSIVSLLFLIPQIIIYGNEIFKSDGDIVSGGIVSNVIVYGSMIIEFALGIWSIVLCVIAISEVQKLSIGKSILNLILPAIVIMTPILIIALVINVIN